MEAPDTDGEPCPATGRAAGLVLAAGAGRRMGHPKALLREPDGTSWVARSTSILLEAGCVPVVVVLGAAMDEVRRRVPLAARTVVAPDWETGMGASLRAGLDSLGDQPETVAALITLVDLPDVGVDVMRRVLTHTVCTSAVLARAAYAGRPGHPVLLGRDHWEAALAGAVGDRGARDHLAAHHVRLIECGDLASGRDADHPDEA